MDFSLSAKFPRAAAAVGVVATCLLALPALGVRHRYEIEDFFPRGTSERVDYDRAVERFGRDDRVGVLVVEAPRPFDAGSVATLDALTRRLEARDDLERVVSLTNALIPVRRGDDVLLERAVPAKGVDDARLAELFSTFAQPPYAGALLSTDRTLAVVGAVLRHDRLDFASRATLLAAMESEREALERAGFRARLAGYPLQRVRLARLAASESRVFLPAALAVILLVAAVSFRSPRAVALPLAVAGAAAVWTTGLMGLTGLPPNIFAPAVYVMVTIVGVADAVHLLARRGELLALGAGPREAVRQSLREVGPSCFYASLTTAFAFATLVFTEIPMIAHMGLQVALGVGAAFVLTMLWFPLFMGAETPRQRSAGRLTRISAALERFASRRPAHVVFAFALVFLGCGHYAVQVRVNSPLLSDLDPNHPIRVTNRLLEERLSGVIPLDVIVEPPPGERIAAYDRAHLDAIDGLTRELRALPDVLWATSAADPLHRLGALLRRVPTHEVTGLLPTALLLAPEQVRPWVDERSDAQRIRLRLRDLDTDDAFALFAQIARATERALGQPAVLTGQGYLAQVANRAIVEHFRRGFLVALVGVVLLLLLAFRDPRLALVSLLPNLFPVVAVAGVMGATGVDLRYTSALVLAVVFGLAVDDTIHVLAQLRRNAGEPDPVAATCRVAGPGLLLTSVLVAAGFGVLGLSAFLPLRVMGGLLALTAVFALAADMVLLPALLRLLGFARTDRGGITTLNE